MARIPLRTYNREIENLIDRGQIEEAIAHAKNILKQYPKHIETYRLLGKAYLESQRYSEASDILQRVLSVIPDDFVSQLGMSIIREDEGNLDAAIWHMERAYEVQPFNRAVQDELRRLYGRRDGVEPPRVRLTRGSLVRMYARGELFPQAIAETRAALAEDAQRLDLLVLLARMYYLSGQKVEAAEIASSLIGKLPYCLEANRILMDILPDTSRADEARGFQRRVYDLDPYAEFITPNTPTSAQVPDQSVNVERVDWQPSMQDQQSPDWARTIGVKWDEGKEEVLPDWLNTIGSKGSSDLATTQDRGAATADEVMPDFMRNAGWSQSNQAEEPGGSDYEIEEPGDQPIEQADVPDWLKSMAPTNVESAAEPDQNRLNWLDSIIPAAGAAAIATAGAQEPDDETVSPIFPPEQPAGKGNDGGVTGMLEPETLDWLSQPSTGQTTADNAEPVPSGGDDLPDWFKDFGVSQNESAPVAEAPNVPEFTSQIPAPAAEDDLPAWLQDGPADANQVDKLTWIQEPETPTLQEDQGDLPAWLNGEPTTQEPTQDLPSWLSSETELKQEAEPSAGEPPAWLNSMDSQPAAAANAPADLPDWLKELEPPEAASAALEPAAVEDKTTSKASAPDWLSELQQTSEEETPQSDVPAWLASGPTLPLSAPPAPVTDATLPQKTETAPDREQPEMQNQESAAGITVTQMDAAAPDMNDMDAAMAWLEALAAKQGADAETLKITAPDQRTETPPDWISSLAQEGPSTEIEPAAQADWMKELPEAVDQVQPETAASMGLSESPETEAVANADLSDWLSSLDRKDRTEQTEETTAPAAESLETGAQDWLQQLTDQESASQALTQEQSAAEETLPDWLQGLPDEATEQPTEETEALAVPTSEMPDWMQEFASQKSSDITSETEAYAPAPIELPAAEETADVAEEDLPAWLHGLPDETIEQAPESIAAQSETAMEPTAGVPDWMQELSSEQTAESGDTAQAAIEPVLAEEVIPEAQEDLPAWLRDISPSEPEPTEIPAEPETTELSEPLAAEIPDWLTQPAQNVETEPGSVEETQPHSFLDNLVEPEAETPTQPVPVKASVQDLAPIEPVAQAMPDLNDMDSAMAWLEALAAKQGAEPESLKITPPEQRSESLPDWIASLAEEQPDQLAAPSDEISAIESAAVEAETAQAENVLPLDTVPAEEVTLPEAAPEMPISEPLDEAPVIPLETTPLEASVLPSVSPDLSDMDSALAWLEGLAAKQGAEPESLKISTPEERLETPPDWIAQLAKETDEQQEAAVASEPVGAEIPTEESALVQAVGIEEVPAAPETLQAVVEEPEQDLAAPVKSIEVKEETPAPASEPEIPDWLLNYEEEQMKSSAVETPVQPTAADETITVWLQRNHPEPGTEIPVVEEAPATTEPVLPVASSAGPLLTHAANAVMNGEIDRGVELYNQVIQQGVEIDAVITQLKADLDRHPVDVSLWQSLGDAYIRADRIQEALDAYTKAEELLR
jgi:hypothetical protein